MISNNLFVLYITANTAADKHELLLPTTKSFMKMHLIYFLYSNKLES